MDDILSENATEAKLSSSFITGCFEPLREESQETTISKEPSIFRDSTQNESDIEVDACERYLTELWGSNLASYFLHPVFHRSTRNSARRRQTLANLESDPLQPIMLGGYPTGMLRGARVPFRPELASWLSDPIVTASGADWESSQSRRESLARRWSTMSLASSLTTLTSSRKPSTVFSLLDLLRLHTGANAGAQRMWEFLRNKSNDLLMRKEQELDANQLKTFATFAREQVLQGRLKPPLCDFIRSNPSANLALCMGKLKAPEMEKKFRQMRAMAMWAERNREQFRTMAYQHDLKDMLTDAELDELIGLGSKKIQSGQSDWPLISQADAERLFTRLPPLEERKHRGPLERPTPQLENLFTVVHKSPTRKSIAPLVVQNVSHRSDRSRDKVTSQKSTKQLKTRMLFLPPRGLFGPAPLKSETPKSIQKPDQLDEITHLIENYKRDTDVPPLCWSQLIEQYRRMRHRHLDRPAQCDEIDRETDHSDRSAYHHYPTFKGGSRGLWKPDQAVMPT